MLKRIYKRLKSFKPLRRLITISIIIALYFLAIGLISEIVDQRAIEQELKDWFESSLNHSTFVDIDHTDTALRSDWRTDLYIHEFDVASPNPEFILPIISIDTIRASSSLYSLFGGVQAKPVIQLRDGVMNIEKKANGAVNYQSISIDSKPSNPYFLPNIMISSMDFILMNCKLVLNLPDKQATIPLNGKFKVENNTLTLKSSSVNCSFSTNIDGIIKKYTGNIFIKNLRLDIITREIKYCDIILEDIPAGVLNMLIPDLPSLPSGLKINGDLYTSGNSLIFSGQIENLNIPSLPGYFDLEMSTNRSFLNNPEYYHIKASSNNATIITIKAEKAPDGKWKPLQQYISAINIDNILSGERSEWINFFVNTFPAIKAVVSSAVLANFDIGEAVINIVKTETGETNISLAGDIASGKLNLLAQGISLSNITLPKTVMATLQIKDAADTLLKFSKNLPRILDCTPTRGSGEIALLYQRSGDDTVEDRVKVQINLKDVVIPRLSGGDTINSLASLPAKLNNLNKLCSIPQINMPSEQPVIIEAFPEITFDSLSVSYETNNNHAIRLSSIEAKSKELGDLHGRLYKLGDDSLQLELNITNIPQNTIAKAQLKSESENAVLAFKEKSPLRINLLENKHEIISEDLYIAEIYRNWLNHQTLARMERGEHK